MRAGQQWGPTEPELGWSVSIGHRGLAAVLALSSAAASWGRTKCPLSVGQTRVDLPQRVPSRSDVLQLWREQAAP